MKTIGLLGGMSWESTTEYYKLINQGIKRSLGDLNSAQIILRSVNFQEIEELQSQGNWSEAGIKLAEYAVSLQKGGADFLVICTNTMHKVVPSIEQSISIPILHIADATGEKLIEHGVRKVALLGTKITMEQDFYKKRLSDKYGLQVSIPNESDREIIHDVIYQELCLGIINKESRAEYQRIIKGLSQQGAEAVILGCTEIGLLISQKDACLPLFDTSSIHAEKTIEFALMD